MYAEYIPDPDNLQPYFILLNIAAVGIIIVFYGLLAGAVFGPLSGTLPMLWVLLQITAVYLFFGRTLKRVNQSINIILPRLGTYVNLIMQIVSSDLKSQEGLNIIRQLSADQQERLEKLKEKRAEEAEEAAKQAEEDKAAQPEDEDEWEYMPVKKAMVEADTEEELMEKILGIDWDSIEAS